MALESCWIFWGHGKYVFGLTVGVCVGFCRFSLLRLNTQEGKLASLITQDVNEYVQGDLQCIGIPSRMYSRSVFPGQTPDPLKTRPG